MRSLLKAAFVIGLAATTTVPGTAQVTERGGVAPPTYASILKRAMPSVVAIHVAGREIQEVKNPFFDHPVVGVTEHGRRETPKSQPFGSSGSGVIFAAVKNQGLILTCFHVVENAERIGVSLNDGRAFEATLVGRDAATDTAVLRVDAPGLPAIPIGTGLSMEVGDIVFAIGSPLGLDATATMGIVSSMFRSSVHYRPFEGYIQHDASVNPGNSGGALVNARGELVGINTAIRTTTGASVGLSFAQPIGLSLKIAHELVEYGRVRRGEVGLRTADLTPRLVAERNLSVSRGALIEGVAPGSSAEKAGLKPGDVIVETGIYKPSYQSSEKGAMSMVPITSQRAIETVLGIHGIGDKLVIAFYRGPERNRVEVEVRDVKAVLVPREPPADLKRLNGLVVSELPPEHPRFGEVNGVLVTDVKTRTVAEFSGFMKGDIIIKVNGTTTRLPDDLFELVAQNRDDFELRVLRQNVPVRLRLPF